MNDRMRRKEKKQERESEKDRETGPETEALTDRYSTAIGFLDGCKSETSGS